MIEKTILNYLNQHLVVEVYMEQPEKPPASYVVLEKTNGGEANCINAATIAIQSYAKTMEQAMDLNEDVKAAMKEITRLPSVASAKLNSDHNFTDTSTKRYRYQAIYNMNYY